MFLQEAKKLKLANFVDTSTWIIRHGTVADENDTDDRLGSAVLIRRSVACCLTALGQVSSGHHAVQLRLTVPAP